MAKCRFKQFSKALRSWKSSITCGALYNRHLEDICEFDYHFQVNSLDFNCVMNRTSRHHTLGKRLGIPVELELARICQMQALCPVIGEYPPCREILVLRLVESFSGLHGRTFAYVCAVLHRVCHRRRNAGMSLVVANIMAEPCCWEVLRFYVFDRRDRTEQQL